MDSPKYILLTIDVEDWFQVENLRPWNPISAWDRRELRVEANVYRLLDLFDSFELPSLPASQPKAQNVPAPSALKNNPENPVNPVRPSFAPRPCSTRCQPSHGLPEPYPLPASILQPPATKKVRGTFFVLGWLAERLPHLVREIAARGHEVASHGSSHRMCRPLEDAELREDLGGSKRLLEDITGAEVAGFRAPNFSVDDRVLALIRECGYRYDSSYNSFALHGRYGRTSLNGDRMGIAYRVADDFFELPVSNLSLEFPSLKSQASSPAKRTGTAGFVLPWSGGAYFRLLPLGVFQRGVRSILNKDGAYVFYMHPWEVDPGQPRVEQATIAARFKHYTNLEKTADKLRRMMEKVADCRFVTCWGYLEEKEGVRKDFQYQPDF